MPRLPRLLAPALLAALAACTAAPAPPPAPPPAAASALLATPPVCGFSSRSELLLPATERFPTLPTRIDGTPAWLVIDTGSVETVLSFATAARAHLTPDFAHPVRATGIGGAGTYPTARVSRLLLGTVPVRPGRVILMPQVPVADGNVGMDILGRVDLDLDLPARRIVFWRGQLCAGTGPPWQVAASEVPTVAVTAPGQAGGARPRHLLLRVRIDGHEALALLDTGAGHSLVRQAFVARLGVSAQALAASPEVRLAGLSADAARGRLWRFRSLTVGAVVVRGPTMLVAHLPGAPFDVLLGIDFLATHRVWLSYGARRVFVAKATD
jgi:predicted aspartyl protease